MGLTIYVYITIKDASIQTVDEPSARSLVVVFLMLVVPGILVAIGSCMQAVHRKQWALALVLVGGLCSFIFIGLNAGFAFAYSQDVWGQRAVFADLVAVTFTLAAALINTMVSVLFPNRL